MSRGSTELRAFFDRYAKLSRERGSETQMAELYAPSFIVAGPQGSASFANDDTFLAWLTQVYEGNETQGMRSLEVVSVEPTALSPIHTLAIVRWGARFGRTGDRRIEFQIAYLLERTSTGFHILSYISQADEEAMKKAEGIS